MRTYNSYQNFDGYVLNLYLGSSKIDKDIKRMIYALDNEQSLSFIIKTILLSFIDGYSYEVILKEKVTEEQIKKGKMLRISISNQFDEIVYDWYKKQDLDSTPSKSTIIKSILYYQLYGNKKLLKLNIEKYRDKETEPIPIKKDILIKNEEGIKENHIDKLTQNENIEETNEDTTNDKKKIILAKNNLLNNLIGSDF